MSNLLLIAFPSEEKAEQGRRELLSMEKANLIAIEDAVIGVKKPDEAVRLDQLAKPGALWGIRAAASGNPGPIGAGALTDFGTKRQICEGCRGGGSIRRSRNTGAGVENDGRPGSPKPQSRWWSSLAHIL